MKHLINFDSHYRIDLVPESLKYQEPTNFWARKASLK